MIKTGHQIEGDIYNLLKTSAVASMIGGNVYRKGMRPRDSKTEDMVVIFTSSDAEQIQDSTVTINIYVPDIYPYDNGIPVENGARCEALESALQSVLDSVRVSTDYLITLKDAIHTQRDEEIQQSFVVARLRLQRLS